MVVSRLADLPAAEEIAVIINVGTKYVTTLALLSTLRHARIPTIVIDCESRDGSWDWFRDLLRHHDFFLMSAPLRPHGEALDWFFGEVPAQRVLLVDSDVEVIASEMLERMRLMLEGKDRLFGSGPLHEACWFPRHFGTGLELAAGIGYFKARPWIPFTLLRTSSVRLALSGGRSFMSHLALNEMGFAPLLPGLLWRRFRFGVFRRKRLAWLDPFRKPHDGFKPAYVYYDTGAEIHEYLTREMGLGYGSIESGAVPWSVTHLAGLTRKVLDGSMVDAISPDEANSIARERLRQGYGLTV